MKHMEPCPLASPHMQLVCRGSEAAPRTTSSLGAHHLQHQFAAEEPRRQGRVHSPAPRTRRTIPGKAAHYRACACAAWGRWPGSGMAGGAWVRAGRNTGPLGGPRLLHSPWSTRGVQRTRQDGEDLIPLNLSVDGGRQLSLVFFIVLFFRCFFLFLPKALLLGKSINKTALKGVCAVQ